ncbi:MAG: M56 family metallopeptidase [Bacteroidota bacterium]
MSPELLEYGLRATTIWALLLAYYFLWGRKMGFRFQRVLLLGGWLLGLTIPLLPTLETAVPVLPSVALPSIQFTKSASSVAGEAVPIAPSWHWVDLLPWVYAFGALILGARTLVQSWRTRQCLADGEQSAYAGYPVVHSSRVRSPFAAYGYVFMPQDLDPALTHTALLHETAHLRSRHHYDKTLMTLSSILLWFHPLSWVYWRLLATVHEYEADAAVLQTVPARTYGLQLLHCSLGPTASLGLFSSPLKQRIEMIIAKTPRAKGRFLPVLALGLLLAGLTFSCSDLGQSSAIPSAEILPPYEDSTDDMMYWFGIGMIGANGGLLQPRDGKEYDASAQEVIEAVYQEVRYPKWARAKGLTGKVRASVFVGQDGIFDYKYQSLDNYPYYEEDDIEVTELVIVGHPDAEVNISTNRNPTYDVFTEEVARVLESVARFTPPTKNGQPIAFFIVLDLHFKLER